jgi:hypothetical protein
MMAGGYDRETTVFVPRGAVNDLRLDFRIAGLVLRAVPQTSDYILAVVLAAMTLLASIAAMIAVAVSAFLFAGIGALVLRACKLQIDSKLERMTLFGLGTGVIVFVLLVTLGELSGNTRAGVRTAVAAAAALGLFGAEEVVRACRAAYREFLVLFRGERLVAYAICGSASSRRICGGRPSDWLRCAALSLRSSGELAAGGTPSPVLFIA